MTENTGKAFKVPKIRKEFKDGLREVDINSRDAKEINHILQRSYIEGGYKSLWELKTAHYVQNKELEDRYRQKKMEMKDEGRNARDLAEQYSFLLFRDKSMVPHVAKSGLKCRSLPFNALGNSKFGLYLCRNADIQLRLAENWEIDTCVMIVFKITPGKCKVLISGTDGGEGMEPTPNYDCHVAQYQPRSCDPIHLQLARSQIYLYEYTEDCEPSEQPRQCLPYAVLTYQKAQNKSQAAQPQSDSYSKRPAPVTDRSRTDPSDSDIYSRGEAVNLGDPRSRRKEPKVQNTSTSFNPKDPRLAYIQQQGGDESLCVPRLTPGPPPSTPGPQPSYQGSAWSREPNVHPSNYFYNPSFGPQFENSGQDYFLQQQQFQPVPEQRPYVQQTNQIPPPVVHDFDNRLQRPPNQGLDPRLRDPRLQRSDTDIRKTVTKKLSLDDYKQKVGIQPVLMPEKTQEESSNDDGDEMYDPSNPSMDTDEPVTAQSNSGKIKTRRVSEEAVENPDDMVKALNELSDPDDASQSPKRIADEVEEEDPVLAAAMRMLVEHSGDVSLFTEALRKLQESAEEIGDALHDPAFLVKAIAENVQSLTKSKEAEKIRAQTSENYGANENKLPNVLDSKINQTYPIKMEMDPITPQQTYENKALIEESAMAKAMKNTLDELNKAEQVPAPKPLASNIYHGEVFSYPMGNLKSDEKRSDVIDLGSIPMPVDIQQIQNAGTSMSCVQNVNLTLDNIPLPGSKQDISAGVAEQKPYHDRMKTNKPLISFSLNKTNSIVVPDSFRENEAQEVNAETEDKDERMNSKSFNVDENDHNKFRRKEVKVLELDKDYRIQEKDRYLGLPIVVPSSSKDPFEISEIGINTPKDSETEILLMKDKDDRRQSSQAEVLDKDERLRPIHSTLFVDDFQDKDERQKLLITGKDIGDKKETGMDKSIDMLDKDERILNSDLQNIQDPSLLDKDERRSRSQSPSTVHPVFLDTDERVVEPSREEQREDDIDRIRSRSVSPLSPPQEPDISEVKIIPLHNLDDSQSSNDSGLFDAYSLGNDTVKKEQINNRYNEVEDKANSQAENEFGDVDWRLAAEAAEMGDVDLRATKSSSSQGEGDIDLRALRASGLDPRMTISDIVNSGSDPRRSVSDQTISGTDSRISVSDPIHSSSDTRISGSDPRASSSDSLSQPPSDNFGPQNPSSYMNNTDYRPYLNTSNMQPMVGPHPDAVRPEGSYNTSRPNLEAYTTYKGPIASYSTSTGFGGEYTTGGCQGRSYGDQYSYSTGGKSSDTYWTGGNRPESEQYSSFNTNANQGGPLPAGGIQNVMNNLDFSSLKNILAIVRSPGLQGAPQNISPNKQPASFMQEKKQQHSQQVDDNRPQSEQTKTESDEERENQPAFCTGLSFLKSKQPKIDKTRAKYTGMARTNADGTPAQTGFQHGNERKPSTGDLQEAIPGWTDVDKNHPEGGAMTLPGFDPPNRGEEITSGIIPGFGSALSGGIPGLGMIDQSETLGSAKPFTFSEDIPDRDISSTRTEDSSGKDAKKSDKSDSKNSDKADGKSKSPRKKSKRNKAESSDSDFTESWQNAILESMEQSALNVKSDDSICIEEEPAPVEPESKSLVSEALKTDEGIKRSLDEDKDDTEKVCKRIKVDPDSDDEGDGLVIDLDMSHTSKEVEKPEASAESIIMIQDDNEDEEDKLKIVESVTDTDGRGTPVLDEKGEEEEIEMEKELEEDTVTVPSTNNGLKSFIEKKRKNIVIKLKGATKKVNPKTGKAYTENAVGCAIEVLGQPKKGAASQSNVGQQIHPIHGIVSLGNRPNSTLQGSSISTLINRNPVPKVNNPMPVGAHFNQQSLPLKEYTHPYTGQTVAYPAQAGSKSQLSTPAVINHFQGTGFHLGSPPVQSLPIIGQPYGMTIPTLGSPSSQPFQRTVSENKQFANGDEQAMRVVTLKSEKNYELSQSNAITYIKTDPDLGSSIADSKTRKRSVTEISELGSDVKKIKTEPKQAASLDHRVVKVLTDNSQKIDEPSTSGRNNPLNADGKNTGDDSELEDGEISDDDDTDIIPNKHSSFQDKSYPDHDQWSEHRGFDRKMFSSYSEYSSRKFPSHRNGPPLDDRHHRAASEWSDLLHHSKHPSKFSDESSSVLSKSAETFSKAKQKLQARNQVKTLGDWLKVELEIDNIEPLQKVIPYSLNTDLSAIPKQRRRKIRFKVKNTIEQEGSKHSKFTSNANEPQEHESDVENLIYKPEVSRDQIQEELNMVRDFMGTINAPSQVRMNVPPILFKGKPLKPGSFDETVLMTAFILIETEMLSLLGRTNFYGYPHRRVPKDILLESEYSGFRSCHDDVFLVLMQPISMKARQKLSQFKQEIVKLYKKKEKAIEPQLVENEIRSKLNQRQSLLRSFTGYLNKKRIAKLQDLSDKFTMVFEFFKSQDPPPPHSALKFIWTSLEDIRQHLLIAEKYLIGSQAMEITKPTSDMHM